MLKQSLRQQMLDQRRQLSGQQIKQDSSIITDILLSWPVFQDAQTCMAFLSMADEPQLDAVIEQLIQDGKTVCVPRLQPVYGQMEAAALTSLSEVSTIGRLNLRVPNSNCPTVSPERIDIILVPGVAFDKRGTRLGMGAGYYDRYLSRVSRATLAGVAWSFQILDEIPQEQHDIPVRWLITEDGIYDCMQGKI